ncbi:hypothetical protein F66182_11131, partial [Fusarium sp. NRRL 66182]
MEPTDRDKYHMAMVVPFLDDYQTARALLHETYLECSLLPSRAGCTLGKIGSHYIVLVGKAGAGAGTVSSISVLVENTISDLLREYPSIRAGFLIGSGANALPGGIAQTGDVVVGLQQ